MRIREAFGVFGSVSLLAIHADAACNFLERGSRWLLTESCRTDHTIYIPDGITLDGRGFTIEAIDPESGHFIGAVVQNEGESASVRDLVIRASGLANTCDSGLDGLRGVLLLNASGSIRRVHVFGLNQGPSSCQEGNAIEVQNFGAEAVHVTVSHNFVTEYQKTGIAVLGSVRAQIHSNVVTGLGPIDYSAQNGIQVGWGPQVHVTNNYVSGNSYTGPSYAAAGILIIGGPEPCPVEPCPYTEGAHVVGNALLDNDVGVFLDNLGAGFAPPPTPTRNRVVANVIGNRALTNGAAFQAGVLDYGNSDALIANLIWGAGYDPDANPGAITVPIYAEPPWAVTPIVRANRFIP